MLLSCGSLPAVNDTHTLSCLNSWSPASRVLASIWPFTVKRDERGKAERTGEDVIDLQLVQDGDFITGQDVDAKPQIKFSGNIFSHTSSVSLHMSRKYLNNHWITIYRYSRSPTGWIGVFFKWNISIFTKGIGRNSWYRHSWSLHDEFEQLWWFPDFSSSAVTIGANPIYNPQKSVFAELVMSFKNQLS